MKAAVIRRFGSPEVLEIVRDYPCPTPLPNQVLLRVKTAGINPLDCKPRQGQLYLLEGARFPIILGNDVSGTIVEVGSAVTKFKVGEDVFCFLDADSQPSWTGFAKGGAYAEFAVTRADTLALKPKLMSHTEAASVPLAALTAYQVFQRIGVKSGAKVLINGASGGVGSFAVQFAKNLGCFVTAVCSENKRAVAVSSGADQIINYKEHPITGLQATYDVIYDVAMTTSFAQCRHLLSQTGIFVSNANLTNPLNMLTTWFFRGLRFVGVQQRTEFAWVKPSGGDLEAIAQMIDKGFLRTAIDRVYALEDIRLAHEYSESGRVQGKIVIDID
ncbi:MAG TPA: NAD(P)-dependent alcohol dehydrogenase [Anaerolineales bacterium]|nr:NAD(P)-dependent alcohol dehydrogenase [Anaerolineales bacterium]